MRPDDAVNENVAHARNGSALGISRLMWSSPSCSHGYSDGRSWNHRC